MKGLIPMTQTTKQEVTDYCKKFNKKIVPVKRPDGSVEYFYADNV